MTVCLYILNYISCVSLVTQSVKSLPAIQETQVWFPDWEDPLEKEMATTPLFLPGQSHGERSLAGYSLWGRKSWKQLSNWARTNMCFFCFLFFFMILLLTDQLLTLMEFLLEGFCCVQPALVPIQVQMFNTRRVLSKWVLVSSFGKREW